MARKKSNRFQELYIERYAAEGKSIAHLESGKTIFVVGAVPGDTAKVFIQKNKKSFAAGKAVEIIKESEDRITPFCEHFGTCGGCKWQMLSYKQQLIYKEQQVKDQMERIGDVEVQEFLPILACEEDRYYRNKVEFTFCTDAYLTSDEIKKADGAIIEKSPALGFHAPGLFDKVVDIKHCYLQEEPTNKIKNFLRDYCLEKNYRFYDFRVQEGWLRNIIIRVSTLGEVLVNLVVHKEKKELFTLLDDLLSAFPEITSLNYTINPKKNDSIADLKVQHYKGKAYISEQLGNYTFKISPKSFFQTNSKQAKILYDEVKAFAELKGNEVVYDLYCGTGSIGLYLSDKAKHIVGIELVEEAIADAKENADKNQVEHCNFFVGDVSKLIDDDFFQENGHPDVIITDPPRAGMTAQLIKELKRIAAEKIVYVSCNPATQARDLQDLSTDYDIIKMRPVDMFPQTHHIENIALLKRKMSC